jgi:hypothetical protein
MAELVRVVSQPWTPTRVGDELLAALAESYEEMCASVGFVNASGVRHIASALEAFRERGGVARLVVGVDGQVTSETGVRALMRRADEVWLFRHPGRPLFHPKTYLFQAGAAGLALIGSANLTESALWVNYEDLAVLEFDLALPEDVALFEELKQGYLRAVEAPNAHRADETILEQLRELGLLRSEAEARRERHRSDIEVDQADADRRSGDNEPLFPQSAAATPPASPLLQEELEDAEENPPPRPAPRTSSGNPPASAPVSASHSIFVLRLGRRDTGTQAGYSPDVFIPMAAYRADPEFWGPLSKKVSEAGKEYRERYVEIEFRRRSGNVEQASRRLYEYRDKSEFRLNAREIHADSTEGDLMAIELAPPGVGVEYVARVVKPTDPLYAQFDDIASSTVANSDKRWGYA